MLLGGWLGEASCISFEIHKHCEVVRASIIVYFEHVLTEVQESGKIEIQI